MLIHKPVEKVFDAFIKGDRVFGVSAENLGAHAEYICLSEDSALAVKPDNVGYDGADGIVDGGLTALFFLKG